MRRKKPTQDSLELFLDTICNMFGGFLFIMLFVVVSLQSAREKKIETMLENAQIVNQENIDAAEKELREKTEELENRKRRRQDSQEFIERLNDPQIITLYEETLEKKEKLRAIVEENDVAKKTLQTPSRETSDLERENKRLKNELAKAQAERQDAQETFEKDKSERARKISAPKMKRSQKNEIGVVLKYGRLYFWHKFNGKEFTMEMNDEDFIVVEENEKEIKTEPKPWAGIDLEGPDAQRELQTAFKRCRPSRDKISVVVAQDSYDEYGILALFLKQNGFDMRPIVGKPGESVADRGGSDNIAQ